MGSLKQRLASKKSALSRQEAGELRDVAISDIKKNPDQPRKFFKESALKDLTASVKRSGVIQPVIIKRKRDTLYLVAGERRLRAAEAAGLTQIPAILTEKNATEIALIENLQRENLKPLEEAEALDQMKKEFNYTQENLARVIGKGRSTITEILSINKLPESIKKECRLADMFTRKHLIAIVRQKTPQKMHSLFEKIKKENLSSNQAKKAAKKSVPKKQRASKITFLAQTFKTQNTHIKKLIKKKSFTPDDQHDITELFKEWTELRSAMEVLSKKIK